MSSQSLDDLAARLKALEREHRRLKGLLGIAALSLGAVAATDAPPKTVEALEFVLKDDAGHVRARLGLSSIIYGLPASPMPSPSGTPDPLDRVLGERRAKPEVQEVKASTACLSFMGSSGVSAAEQCTSWEDQAQTFLRFRTGRRDQVNISSDGEGAVLALGGLRSRLHPEDHGRLALGAHRDGAWLKIEGPPNEEALLEPRSLTISDES